MRKKGSVCEFTIQRNEELKRVFKHAYLTRDEVTAESLFGEVAMMSASRFYVSEMRTEKVLRYYWRYGRWSVKSVLRRRMFGEIERRVTAYLAAESDVPALEGCKVLDLKRFRNAIFEVVNSPAPSFYITKRSCRTLLYEVLGQRKRMIRFNQINNTVRA